MEPILQRQNLSVVDVENLRLHYARTLQHWLARFDEQAAAIGAMFDEVVRPDVAALPGVGPVLLPERRPAVVPSHVRPRSRRQPALDEGRPLCGAR